MSTYDSQVPVHLVIGLPLAFVARPGFVDLEMLGLVELCAM